MAFKPKNKHEQILHRLKIARGHLDRVIQMTESNDYCISILHQIIAVEKGLKETGNLILEDHLQTCVADAITGGEKNKAIDEVMQVFRKIQ